MLSHLSLLHLLQLAGSRAQRIMSKESKCCFILTRFRRCFPTHNMYIFQRICFHFLIFFFFFLTFWINRSKEGFRSSILLSIQWIRRRWSSEILCWSSEETRHTHRAHITIKDCVRKRDCFFIFFSCFSRGLTASSCRTTQVSGVLKPALHWEKRLGEHGKRGYVHTQFSSRMEVFHVVNREMPTQLDDRRLRLFLLFMHVLIHKDGWRV